MNLQELQRSIQHTECALCSGMATMSVPLRAFGVAAQNCWDTAYHRYLAAGAPYGETPEGCLRWWREVSVIVQQRQAQRDALADERLRERLRQIG